MGKDSPFTNGTEITVYTYSNNQMNYFYSHYIQKINSSKS